MPRRPLLFAIAVACAIGLAAPAHGEGPSAPAQASTPVATPSLRGLPATLAAPAVVSIDSAPAGSVVRWSLDGVEAPAGPDLVLDPHALQPGTHNLVATLSVDGQPTALEASFTVPALPPRLVSPLDVPALRAGDVLLLTIASQGAPPTVRYAIDGDVVQVDDAPPYRFVVPPVAGGGLARLAIELSDANGTTPYAFDLEPPGEPGRSWATLGAAALGLLLLIGGAVAVARFVAQHWRRRRVERVEPPSFDGHGPAFERWAGDRAARPGVQDPVAAADAGAGPSVEAWGRIVVIAGPDQGTEFELNDDAELAGRGPFCSVRLRDRAVADAHVIFNRDGTFRASSPGLLLEVDGISSASGSLGDGAEIRIGSTLLKYRKGPR